ncbi:MAG: vitamin B12 dependent-methionine synthase activation domain-containing protein, partial [Pseudomonadota bacterium]
ITPPKLPGTHVLADYPLERLVETIDWTPFFRTWELAGNYPRILDDEIVGESARQLFADAKTMLDEIIEQKWLTAHGVLTLLPANTEGDDLIIWADEDRREERMRFPFLRQQTEKRSGRPNVCLSDFVAPVDSGIADFVGGFAVTAGHGIENKLVEFQADHDDYRDILLKALADRLAESFAEHLHLRVRREFWGYAPDESLSNDELIREKYRGIRPAPGYPACPDHSAKPDLFALLGAESVAGMRLTESFAMLPTASVSGFYFGHPDARYFGVAKVGRDQVEDYAARRGISFDLAERYLSPNLGYDPD